MGKRKVAFGRQFQRDPERSKEEGKAVFVLKAGAQVERETKERKEAISRGRGEVEELKEEGFTETAAEELKQVGREDLQPLDRLGREKEILQRDLARRTTTRLVGVSASGKEFPITFSQLTPEQRQADVSPRKKIVFTGQVTPEQRQAALSPRIIDSGTITITIPVEKGPVRRVPDAVIDLKLTKEQRKQLLEARLRSGFAGIKERGRPQFETRVVQKKEELPAGSLALVGRRFKESADPFMGTVT